MKCAYCSRVVGPFGDYDGDFDPRCAKCRRAAERDRA